MSFLDRLWDETLAGPAPEKDLGKLRKYKSLSAARSADHPIVDTNYNHRDDPTVPVSRSITILRTKSLTVDPGSAASSPSSPSSGTSSPFSPGSMGKSPDAKRPFARKRPTFQSSECAEPTTPTVYDWIMISALDR